MLPWILFALTSAILLWLLAQIAKVVVSFWNR